MLHNRSNKLREKAEVEGEKNNNNRMKDSPKNRLMDGCLEVDKGTKHQVGHGRL